MADSKQNGSIYLKLEQTTKELVQDGDEIYGIVGYKFTLSPTLDAVNCYCNPNDYVLTHTRGNYKNYYEFGPKNLEGYEDKSAELKDTYELIRKNNDNDKTLTYEEEEIKINLGSKRKGSLNITCGFKSPFFGSKTTSLTLSTPSIATPELSEFNVARQSKDKITLYSSYTSPYNFYSMHYYSDDVEINGNTISVSESDYGKTLELSCRLVGKDGTVYKQKDISFYIEYPRPNMYIKIGTEIYEATNSYYSNVSNITEEAYGIKDNEIKKVSTRDNF